ncbi:divalent-cation tolerance protein CutA [Magnetovibrio blakemorei]|uniref:Dihydroorotate dehydrogenase n=1 Tax=Magnetovibrio blakemorei TaxID=28181 RepID=A0A1E5Q426_9PROT|nr:divalent-cation tolerance protein CutA [Magnetovibrio blakemorei]OEJ64625.1 dihydroorotate dehydrogenase [Magnetovibrio blakemorei]
MKTENSQRATQLEALQWIYVTAPNREAALDLARTLVKERLVACANVMDGVQSVYWWEGGIVEDAEAVVVFKTQKSLVPQLTRRIQDLHSYDCPCIVALDIQDGNPDFLRWIVHETS